MMANKRVSKHWNGDTNIIEITPQTEIMQKNLIQVLLSIKEKDVTTSFIMSLFGEFNGKNLCNPYDTFEVPIGGYKYMDNGKEKSNKNKFITTIGLWIFNIYFFRDDGLSHIFGYINDTINKKAFGKINQTMSYCLLEDKITLDQHKRFLEKSQWIMSFETVLAPNHTEKLLTCTKFLNKKKEELYKKYKEDIDAGNAAVAEQMRNELLAYAKEYLDDDPALDSYLSGGGGSFDNNFGNVFCMKGAVADPDPNARKQYNVALSNYSDGVSADEYTLFANALAAGPYARGKKTETGGYWEKLFISSLQYLVLGPKDSDCGTKHYIEVYLTDKNIKDYMYNYIIEGSKLVELTSDNMSKYIGKTVKMRFSSMCKRLDNGGMICNKCAGNLFYRLGIKNIGAATSRIPSILKNKCMKAFHDSTVKTVEIDPMKAFGLKN